MFHVSECVKEILICGQYIILLVEVLSCLRVDKHPVDLFLRATRCLVNMLYI